MMEELLQLFNIKMPFAHFATLIAYWEDKVNDQTINHKKTPLQSNDIQSWKVQEWTLFCSSFIRNWNGLTFLFRSRLLVRQLGFLKQEMTGLLHFLWGQISVSVITSDEIGNCMVSVQWGKKTYGTALAMGHKIMMMFLREITIL